MKLPYPVSSEISRTSSPISADEAPANQWSLPEVRIVVLYVILASAWIVGSDFILAAASGEQSTPVIVHSIKGLNFVLTTAVLLYLVLRRAYGGWRLAEEQRMAMMQRARERYRNLCSRTQNLREEDRTRIAREIHDELGQLLTSIKMELRQVENVVSDLEDRALNPVIDKLVDTSELVDTTIGAVQRISYDLRPSALDHLGLSAALIDEARLFSRRNEIPCELEIHEPLEPMMPAAEIAIFRIFQETLTNISRHAHARRVDARLSVTGGVLELRIQDDGVGMDPAVLDDPTALGIIGMMERADNIGGALNFSGQPGKGTTVTFSLPVAGKLMERALSA